MQSTASLPFSPSLGEYLLFLSKMFELGPPSHRCNHCRVALLRAPHAKWRRDIYTPVHSELYAMMTIFATLFGSGGAGESGRAREAMRTQTFIVC